MYQNFPQTPQNHLSWDLSPQESKRSASWSSSQRTSGRQGGKDQPSTSARKSQVRSPFFRLFAESFGIFAESFGSIQHIPPETLTFFYFAENFRINRKTRSRGPSGAPTPPNLCSLIKNKNVSRIGQSSVRRSSRRIGEDLEYSRVRLWVCGKFCEFSGKFCEFSGKFRQGYDITKCPVVH